MTEKKLIIYSIDGKANVTILSNQSTPKFWETIYGNFTLPELSDGSHHLEVYAKKVQASYAQVYFTVDTINPKVSDVSIENKTYNTTDISLNFTVNEPATWVGYNLDQQANITIIGNATLTGLSGGSHNLTVYANGTGGNMGSSQTVYFTVTQKTRPRQEPFPTAPVIAASVAAVAVVGAGLLVYFKKRKH